MDSHPTLKLVDHAEQLFGALNPAETKLLTLAQETFQELSESEYRLYRAIANGEPIDYRTHDDAQDNPENAANWGAERVLRGDRIRWLCIEPEVWKLCLPQGIDITGVKIEGSFNLSFSDVEVPLRFFRCYFAEALHLHQTKLSQLDLSGTCIDASEIAIFSNQPPASISIAAESLNVTSSVFLYDGFQARGRVSLAGAVIGGDLNCRGGMLTNDSGDALFAEGINVTGAIFLSAGFVAEGRVSLVGGTLRGDLNCDNGTFSNENGDALFAEGINVIGNVFLRDIQAKGRVTLVGATIGGKLNCSGGAFTSANGHALSAERINVTGGTFLRDGFQAKGRVSLRGATIGGVLICSGGIFTNDNGPALVAESINVTGTVFLHDGFQAKGRVSLRGAAIGGDLNCSGGMFINENEDALLAQRSNVTGTVFLSDGFQARGMVSLASSTIGGDFACGGGRFTNENGNALLVEGITVSGNVFLCNNFQAQGAVILALSTIGRNLDCTRGMFTDDNWIALAAYNLNVSGNVYLSNGFKARGVVNFVSSSIGGDFYCSGGAFTNAKGDALVARSINVAGNVFLDDGFESEGKVSLLNAQIGNTLQIVRVKAPKQMLLDLQFARVQTLEHAENSFPEQGNLQLNGLLYKALAGTLSTNSAQHLQWLQLQPKESFSPQPYEQLAKVLHSIGEQFEAVQVLIGKEEAELKYGDLGWFGKAWKWFLGKTIAYGYRPERAIFWSLGVITIGALLFSVGYQNGLIPPTDKDCDRAPSTVINDCPNHPDYPKFNPVIYSLDVFLPIIDLRLKNTWLPSANQGNTFFHLKCGAWLRYWFWFQTMAGWVLTTLWVAGFTGLVRSTNK